MLDASNRDLLTEVETLIAALRNYEVDIRRALAYGGDTHTYEQLCAKCIIGEYDVYTLPNSVIICETARYPNLIAYNVFIACGDLQEIIDAQNGFLIREAKLRSATKLTMAGRLGWVRKLKTEGWDYSLAVMEKDISDGKD